ncbi:hypothetical protein SNOG_16126 [Parastagonospora nodorum SN15]|nr:hypothetical protein SNOG_16126 [Parastagonospora nodorum SN15]EAT76498.2 hypothetical protein SNOG_16126 [Parastagonospora nodorum SN15]
MTTPVYFEVLLYYIYEHVWNATVAGKKNHKSVYSFGALSLTPIGVYALADKYGVKGLKACAIDLMPQTTAGSVSSSGLALYAFLCVSGGCGMGLHICLLIIKSMPRIVKDLEMEKLVAKHPAMGADMYLAARRNDGKLW